MRVTILDVAREARTSKATVSKVIRNKPYVSADARGRVLRAIDQLGYLPNRSAQNLVQGRARAIGIAISDVRNGFYPSLIRVIDDRARAAGSIIITTEVDFDEANGVDKIEAFLGGLVDAVVFASWWGPPDALRRLEDRGVPFAFVTCRPIGKAVDYVVIDDDKGAQLAVDHLVGLGHRRIAHITSPEGDWSTERRLNGFREGLRRRGVPMDENLVVTAGRRTGDGFLGRLDGYTAAQALMRESRPPTAVFCADDLIALGAMEAIEESGARVPDDVSIVGFDDIFLAGLPRIGLTTIRQPVEQMGHIVAEFILRRIGDAAGRDRLEVILEPTIAIRGSTAPAPLAHSGRYPSY
jgi:DNA-binding LacI/PurR family transcriptional regulator